MKLSKNKIISFQNFIWDFYKTYGRPFAWRNVHLPYYVVVSEIMLQQTQTYRVEPKFEQFIETFPDFKTLAIAELRHVLAAWQGLGYNRRGKYLQQIAQKVMEEFNGQLPSDPDVLVTFPGIGKATAASICAFAFNTPTIFIETNIRAVYIHSFFKDKIDVHDKELMPLIEQTVDQENAREWYYALMDYGVWLKKTISNPSRKSKHHIKQSKFEGSDRQVRGMIIKLLTEQATLKEHDLIKNIPREKKRVQKILSELVAEKMVKNCNGVFSI